MIYSSISAAKPNKINGKYVTSEFITLTKHMVLNELFQIQTEHSTKFGDMVICLDKSVDGYWRKDVFAAYKSNRKKGRDESDIIFKEVFAELDPIIDQLKLNIPWKVIEIPRAEADDSMLVLAKEYNKYENILIHSPDKDMIQAQRENETVFQYSSLTRKWVVPENKHDNMEHWVQEHVVLGDASDGVPKIVDGIEFSANFLEHLKANGVHEDHHAPYEFKLTESIEDSSKRDIISSFDTYKLNRKKESTGILDIYKDMKFGPAAFDKKIALHGSLDKWLDSHPLLRPNYERNFSLVMCEGIPTYIWNEILINFKEAPVDYNYKELNDWLIESNLPGIALTLSTVFKTAGGLTAESCGW